MIARLLELIGGLVVACAMAVFALGSWFMVAEKTRRKHAGSRRLRSVQLEGALVAIPLDVAPRLEECI